MQTRIVICECVHAGHVDRPKLAGIRDSLSAAGIDFASVPDLCGLAAQKAPALQDYAGAKELHILACYPRSISALFQYAGAPLQPERTRITNLRSVSLETALANLAVPPAPRRAEPVAGQNGGTPGWIPWFPVIDQQRCTNCQQCLSFCLFGVYALSATSQVVVRQPQSCKTNCPACARICPQIAIIFPKHEPGTIAGAEIEDEPAEKLRAQADLQNILGSDVYGALAKRREKARARTRQLLRPDLAQAVTERATFLRAVGNMPMLNHPGPSTEPPPRETGPTP